MGNISQDFPKIWKHYSECGNARKTAFAVANQRVMMLSGIGLTDLADTSDVADLLDGLEDAISSNDSESLRSAMQTIDIEFIQSLIYN